MGRTRIFRAEGIRFVFAYDRDDPTLLHIYARHLTTPQEAMDTFLDPTATTTWNQRYGRFETYSAARGLFWFWLEQGQAVMVISCFRTTEEEEW
ncbi:MAG: hypothetical protein KGJ86_12650 [Chloroflexota bacterium]|nr:hypothetical protein [Chloroflexota bacterium]